MHSYSYIFNNSIEKFNSIEVTDELFKSFRTQYELYHFIDNGDNPPDIEAENIAKQVNIKMWEHYKELLKNRIKLGYTNSTSFYSDYTNLDSRHIMMFVILFTHIPLVSFDSILEIGGGFGNWLTLNKHINFRKWTIIDLPHVSLLQNWYLKQQGISTDSYELISAFDYDKYIFSNSSFDLVIGTHSISEFSYDIFKDYFTKVISKSKYLFYCYHNTRPCIELIQTKINDIEEVFNKVISITSESGNVTNCLYKNGNVF